MKINFKRYGLYLIRWQLSTPILAVVPAVIYSYVPEKSYTMDGWDWVGATVANLIGGLIFFWVDLMIFTSKALDAQWEIANQVSCADCGKISRGYRLVKAKGYDRTKGKVEYRCEQCSELKTQLLRQKGIDI